MKTRIKKSNEYAIKATFLFFVLIWFFIPSDAYTENANKTDSIVIKKAPWHLLTIANVTCHDFEHDISYMEYHISDSIIISDMLRELSSLKKSNGVSLDVRCKIYFYSSGKICKSACIDQTNVLYDGELYRLSSTLKNEIDIITNSSKQEKLTTMRISDCGNIPFPNGRDSLNHYLLSQSEVLYKYIDKPIELVVICQIDSRGKTLNVKIKDKDDTPLNNMTKELFEIITDLFVNDIRWSPNKERFPYETIFIPMRFIVNQ